jgi:hypothetical protein
MFTTIAYSESIDAAGAWTELAACADQHVPVTGDEITIPSFASKVIAIAGLIENVAAYRARLSAPSLRLRGLPMIAPLNVATAGAVEPGSPHAMVDLRDNPIDLTPGERLIFQHLSNPAAAQIQSGVVWLGSEAITPAKGAIRTVRATNASTLVASAWTNGALTFDEVLPVGKYALVGMRAESAGLVAARAVIPGAPNRPGCLGTDALSDIEHPMFRYGALGVWGEFENETPPTIDFLSVSADTAQVVYLDLIAL